MTLTSADFNSSPESVLSPVTRSNSAHDGSFALPCSSGKRRRVSDDENKGAASSLNKNLLRNFDDTFQTYRDEESRKKSQSTVVSDVSDDDGDEEDDDDDINGPTLHEEKVSAIGKRIARAKAKNCVMKNDIDMILDIIPRAKLYEHHGLKCKSWLSKGIVSVTFLEDMEEGEYTHGMIRMVVTSQKNLQELFTVEIDKDLPATLLGNFEKNGKPSYAFRVKGKPQLLLKFPSVDEGLRWKKLYENGQQTNFAVKTGSDGRDTSSGDDVASLMKATTISSPTSSVVSSNA